MFESPESQFTLYTVTIAGLGFIIGFLVGYRLGIDDLDPPATRSLMREDGYHE